MKKVQVCCIIDDDPIFIYGTKRIIKEVDFAENIIVYNNGQEAVDGLKEIINEGGFLPEVIFLDLNMPIMNGWEFLEEYKNCQYDISKKTTIYIISSSVDPRDLERVKHYNEVDMYILKPITPDDLGKILSSTTV
ncbi:Response regulator receiver domain-containing protein [Maribacter orientalis]|uniref:Response regulator receiver domain-containing protein n=1 Tax=Maribacter orientalis TaxID=228957 RepID=A0A1H7KW85_9FLAO|nr:response regulator [Maribacter orientalis]SEK91012.1 Response regulator receiver domain-containing protein [Maribacter orientalis]|tara:strand:+ start:2065 stop:2469 length:405 start_codon:yes stop_codon:yes gene_type:complete